MQNPRSKITSLHTLGGVASLLVGVFLIASSFIYLTGNLHSPSGRFLYSLADLLFGPLTALSLVIIVYSLREILGQQAPRRMELALFSSFAAAFGFAAVALIRAANRQYHLIHPELHLESSATVLGIWAALVAAGIGTAWHFLGWTALLIGSAAWSTRLLPRLLAGLYLLGGVMSLFVYQWPALEGGALLTIVVIHMWLGFLLFMPNFPSDPE